MLPLPKQYIKKPLWLISFIKNAILYNWHEVKPFSRNHSNDSDCDNKYQSFWIPEMALWIISNNVLLFFGLSPTLDWLSVQQIRPILREFNMFMSLISNRIDTFWKVGADTNEGDYIATFMSEAPLYSLWNIKALLNLALKLLSKIGSILL